MPLLSKRHEPPRHPRPKATFAIWALSLLMMGPGVAITLATQSAAFPFAVLGAGVLSTLGVWAFGDRARARDARQDTALRQSREEVAALQSTVEEMRERLECLETISRYERLRDQAATEADAAGYDMADASMGAPAKPQTSASRSSSRTAGRDAISF